MRKNYFVSRKIRNLTYFSFDIASLSYLRFKEAITKSPKFDRAELLIPFTSWKKIPGGITYIGAIQKNKPVLSIISLEGLL